MSCSAFLRSGGAAAGDCCCRDSFHGGRMSGISDKVVRNTYYNFMGMAWNGALSFALAPFILHRLGADAYGVLGVSVALTGYAYLLDMSMPATFIRHVAEYEAKGDRARLKQAVNTMAAFYCVLGIVYIALTLLFADKITGIFKTPPRLAADAHYVVVFSMAVFAFTGVANVFSDFQAGMQRLDLSNKLSIILSIPTTAVLVWLLNAGYGLHGMMWRSALTLACYFAANVILARRIFPELEISPRHISGEMFGHFLKFGMKLHVGRISTLVTGQTDKILIACFLSVGAVTYFQLASVLVVTAASMANVLVSAITPAFSEVHARYGKEAVMDVYLRMTKYLSCMAVPLFMLTMVSARLLLQMWLGGGYDRAWPLTVILASGWLASVLAAPGYTACQAMDKPHIISAGATLNIILNLGLNIILIGALGMKGIAWGTAIALLASSACFWFMLHRAMKLPLSSLAGAVTPFFKAAAIAAAALLALDAAFAFRITELGRWSCFALLSARGVVFCAAYALLLRHEKVFRSEELELIKAKLSALPLPRIAGRA